MWNRKDLKQQGKAAFKKNYWSCVLVAFVLGILTTGSTGTVGRKAASELDFSQFSPTELIIMLVTVLAILLVAIVVSIIIKIFVTNPLMVGGYRFFVRNSEEEKPGINLLLSAYQEGNFVKVFFTMFLKDLYLSLWTLLFIVPGIVKGYSYRMVPYLLADHPEMSPTEIITMSREMMNGHKWNAFVLDLSFILWDILALITCGIVGIFYVNPYVMATNAELYKALKK